MDTPTLTPDELEARAQELLHLADQLNGEERRERAAEVIDGVRTNLSRIAADLATIQAAVDRRVEQVEREIYLPVHFGSPARYISVVRSAAASAGVRCRTSVDRTGLFSKQVTFSFRGQAISVDLLIAWVKDWANANGIGWRPC